MLSKTQLRAEAKKALDRLSPGERHEKSRKIADKLFRLDAFKTARNVCTYVSMPAEVDTTLLIDEIIGMGKRVLVPLTNLENKELKVYEINNRRDCLRPGTLGILEPDQDKCPEAATKDIDIVLVPALLFDRGNNRLGRGAGLYDRFLAGLPARVQKIGLAFSFQVVPQLPTHPHDVRMDQVLTD